MPSSAQDPQPRDPQPKDPQPKDPQPKDLQPRLEAAERILRLSRERWGEHQAVDIVGRHESLARAFWQTERFAAARGPVLVTGETGVGKELFSRALYLGSDRLRESFVAVNCGQYASESMLASELFGHRRGSFTGAVADRRGIFEEADGGMVFLDEVGELAPQAQTMLLRVIGEGEVVPVGSTRPRRVDVRVIAATNRELSEMVEQGRFREDLYFRLRCLEVEVPALRHRGDDWLSIAEIFLLELGREHGVQKRLSAETLATLAGHSWPGNVRELKNLLEVGYHLADGEVIRPGDLGNQLEAKSRRAELQRVPWVSPEELSESMAAGESDFWRALHRPYLDRELNRAQVRSVVAHGLEHLAEGSYKRMLLRYGVAAGDYLKAMDFLRHHDLKPR
ncbi:MAG: sigma 54-interacting transcriptional regulator [Holophagales bacterium]|nr:sigma 54-interacting transcriptional regulator [Holophagales bacterium]